MFSAKDPNYRNNPLRKIRVSIQHAQNMNYLAVLNGFTWVLNMNEVIKNSLLSLSWTSSFCFTLKCLISFWKIPKMWLENIYVPKHELYDRNVAFHKLIGTMSSKGDYRIKISCSKLSLMQTVFVNGDQITEGFLIKAFVAKFTSFMSNAVFLSHLAFLTLSLDRKGRVCFVCLQILVKVTLELNT